ncbi:MAG: hypothetical protein ABIK09_20900 [Pseudomonadota bacterium]
MNRHIRLLFISFSVLLLAVPSMARSSQDYFLPGNEGAVVKLLHPHSDEDLVLGSWALATLEVGPICEIRMSFQGQGTDGQVTVTLTPDPSWGGSIAFSWDPVRPEGLGDSLEALVGGNDPGYFFKGRCEVPVDVEEEEASVEAKVTAWVPSPSAAIWVAALVLALAGLILLGVKGKRKKKAPPKSDA